ncbi:MAG: transposase [Pseudomonadota bacterium]
MGRSRYRIFNNNAPHFLTCTVVNWLPLFSSPAMTQILFDSFNFLQMQQRLNLYAYVIMENHLPLLASAYDLSKEIGDFKSYTARQSIDFLRERNGRNVLEQLSYHKLKHKKDRHYQMWQEGSHLQEIQSREMTVQKLEYIHNNPVKRDYVDDPLHWRYSSARNYHGQKGLLSVCCDW